MAPARRFGFVLLTVCAVAAVWLWLFSTQGSTIDDEPRVGSDTESMTLRGSNPVEATAPVRPTADATREEQPAAAAEKLAYIRGRCIAGETGEPLAGCTVKLRGFHRNSSVVARFPVPEDWKQPKPIETGPDGLFEFAFDPPRANQWSLGIEAKGRVPRTGRWGLIEPGFVDDLGDVEISKGYRVRGIVVDQFAVPVAKVGVRVRNLPLPIRAGMAANSSRSGWSDEQGRFEVGVPIPAGTWSIKASKAGYRHVEPDVVVVEEGTGASDLRVVVRRMPSISGIVVDELGRPVPRVDVSVKLARSGSIPSDWTDKDGRFVLYAIDREPQPVQLEIDDPGPCELQDLRKVYEWGTRDIRIVLRRAVSVGVTVVEKRTGKPVENYAVSCWSNRSRSSLQRDMRLGGRHAGGKVTVDKVWRGKSQLQVFPSDPALLPSETIEFEATDAGAPPMRVEVERMQAVRVRVLRSDRSPVPGTTVEVIRPGTRRLDPRRGVSDIRRGRTWWSSDPKFRPPLLLSAGTTDDDGYADVHAPASDGALIVRARGPHHLPRIEENAVLSPGVEHELVVSAGASLAGRVELHGIPVERLGLKLRYVATRRDGPRVPLQADGKFAADGLPEGEVELRLTIRNTVRTEHGGSGSTIVCEPPLAKVVLDETRAQTIECDAARFVPGRLNGRVYLDGAPATPARVLLIADHWAIGQFATDTRGRLTADGLLPGRYRLQLVVGDFKVGPGQRIDADGYFTIEPGKTATRTFHLVRRRMRVRIVEADGETPLAGAKVFVSSRRGWSRRLETDEHGWLTIDLAPSSKVQVYVRGRNDGPVGSVEIPKGRKQAEFTLRLAKR